MWMEILLKFNNKNIISVYHSEYLYLYNMSPYKMRMILYCYRRSVSKFEKLIYFFKDRGTYKKLKHSKIPYIETYEMQKIVWPSFLNDVDKPKDLDCINTEELKAYLRYMIGENEKLYKQGKLNLRKAKMLKDF